jgi:hypothetical protein
MSVDPVGKICPFCKTFMQQVREKDGTPTRIWLDVQTVQRMRAWLPVFMGEHADLGVYLCPKCKFFALFLDGEPNDN